MSEAQTSYGLHRHKYKVGDTFDFDGIVEIIGTCGYNPAKRECMYNVKMPDDRICEVEESWIDGGIDHFNLDEHGRKQDAEYGVSYIASAPEEFKIGDRVEVVGKDSDFYGNVGIITTILDGNICVRFGKIGTTGFSHNASQLRKLPDIDNPLNSQVGGSHYKDMAIQPVEFCMKNNLDFCTSSAIKYLCRRKKKNGKEDLLKAKHFIDLLIQLEYPE